MKIPFVKEKFRSGLARCGAVVWCAGPVEGRGAAVDTVALLPEDGRR